MESVLMEDVTDSSLPQEARLQLLLWLIDRSDSFRNSYSSRASLVLSADALVLATLAFLLDKVPADNPNRFYINTFIVFSLAGMLASFALAFIASTSLWNNSSQYTNFHEKRYFFNGTQTLNIPEKDFATFKRDFKTTRVDGLVDYACAQLWSSYLLQKKRYRNLRMSTVALFVSVVALVGALLTSFFI